MLGRPQAASDKLAWLQSPAQEHWSVQEQLAADHTAVTQRPAWASACLAVSAGPTRQGPLQRLVRRQFPLSVLQRSLRLQQPLLLLQALSQLRGKHKETTKVSL